MLENVESVRILVQPGEVVMSMFDCRAEPEEAFERG